MYYPTETELAFKVGARVLMLNDDPAGRWVNGGTGEIESVGRNGRRVRIRLQEERNEQTSDEVVDVEPYAWESIRVTLKDGAIATETTGSSYAVAVSSRVGGDHSQEPGQDLQETSPWTCIVVRSRADRRVEKFLDACRDRST